MQQYSFKNSGIEWLSEIPEHWGIHRLFNICNFIRGNSGFEKNDLLSKGKYVALQYGKTYKVEEVNEKFEFYVNEEFFKSSQIVDFGNVIFVSTSETIEDLGHSVYYNRKDIGLIGGEQILLKPKKYVLDGKYLFYSSKAFSKQLNKFATGIKVFRFDQYDLKTIYVALPPLPEQKAIAEYLDKACARIDRIIAIKEEQLRKIEGYFFSRLDEILTCKNNNASGSQKFDQFIKREIPKDWNIDRLRDIVIINDLALSNNTPNDFIINYLDISNVNKYGIVDKSDIRELTFEEAPSRARRVTRKNDTVISSVRTNLQAVAYIDFELPNFTSSTGFFVCRPKFASILKPKFLYYFLLSAYSKDFFFSHSTGVSYPAINDYKFGSINIFYPSPEKQEEIIIQLESLRLKVNEMIKKTESQISTLQSYRKSLIHECVTGKKQVADVATSTIQEINA